ncbi:MAG: glycosyltransferase family 4 protein [Gammaproteobacteria bacterium]|nr:glycosyltransferase family 4 protein [Gammaproteobacteria bacterium]MCY4356991.1 glycosyltransferase family 4 protein [Gammaproteobacteria bacterium]
MKLCFVIYNYFPHGGQQRDFLQIATRCMQRGHEVKVYTLEWQGEIPVGMDLTLSPVKALSRLRRFQRFNEWTAQQLTVEEADLVVGFNKMPHLDVYFAADSCFVEKAENQRGLYYRHTPRYRHFTTFEEAVFGADSSTQVLLLSALQRKGYLNYYPCSKSRLHLLPPGLAEDRRVKKRDQQSRQSLRIEFNLADNQLLLLQIGSGFTVKGVDRALRAIACLPREWKAKVHYMLIGRGRPQRYLRLAKKLGIGQQLTVLPGRDDILRFLTGADLLLHPAYQESAGYVLLEAAVAGLPVLTTGSCGYACHIEQVRAGEVCTEPFQQSELNARLLSMLRNLDTAAWSENGLAFGAHPELYRKYDTAVELLEQFGESGQRQS